MNKVGLASSAGLILLAIALKIMVVRLEILQTWRGTN
jgi:hypothetical protein